MKKNLSLTMVSVVLIITTLLSACSKAEINIDVETLADKLISDVDFKDQMTDIDSESIAKLYDIDSSLFTKSKAYISTGATAEEVAVFEATDKKNADEINDALKNRIEEQKIAFENYVPEEMKKLNSPVIIKEGKYVILCVSDDSTKAKDIINSQTK